MATFSKIVLSGSVNGKQIKITQTATPGTLIHTTVTGTNNLDEVWLWAVNNGTSDVYLTIEWGGVTDPDDHITVNIPFKKGYVLVVPGMVMQNELVVRAFAETADVISIGGFVNRIIT